MNTTQRVTGPCSKILATTTQALESFGVDPLTSASENDIVIFAFIHKQRVIYHNAAVLRMGL